MRWLDTATVAGPLPVVRVTARSGYRFAYPWKSID